MPNRPDLNTLSALVLLIHDLLESGLKDELELGSSAVAGVIAVGNNPDIQVGQLARRLGLSHSGTVRLVQRLEEEGLLVKWRGGDARTVTLHLTEAGEAAKERLFETLEEIVATILEPLEDREPQEFLTLARKVLSRFEAPAEVFEAACRFCDAHHCTRCPTGIGRGQDDG